MIFDNSGPFAELQIYGCDAHKNQSILGYMLLAIDGKCGLNHQLSTGQGKFQEAHYGKGKLMDLMTMRSIEDFGGDVHNYLANATEIEKSQPKKKNSTRWLNSEIVSESIIDRLNIPARQKTIDNAKVLPGWVENFEN